MLLYSELKKTNIIETGSHIIVPPSFEFEHEFISSITI